MWLFCVKNFSTVYRWARWPDVLFASDEQFFKKASEALEPEVEEFGEYLVKTAEEIQVQTFTGEQMCRLECLVEHLGGAEECDPDSEKADFSVS